MKRNFFNTSLVLLLTVFTSATALAQNPFGTKVATLSGNITGIRTLNADTLYRVQGFVNVQPGGRLNIPAGTRLEGVRTTDNNNAPVIQALRGDGVNPSGRIYAEGTSASPIVFTSQRANIDSLNAGNGPQRGDIGGIVMNGLARNNVPGGTKIGEGNAGSGGGTDDNDTSGVLRYVRVEFGGTRVTPNNEINGFTFNSVGRGTVLEYLQAHLIADDAFEWFGGTVNAKYLVATGCDDDNFDCDNSYRGKIQFGLIVQDSLLANRGYEWNNDDNGTSVNVDGIFTRPEVYNVTLVGSSRQQANNEQNSGLFLRGNTAGRIYNHIVTNFGSFGVVVGGIQAKDNFITGTVADSGIIVSNSLFWTANRTGVNGNPDSSRKYFSFNETALDSVGAGVKLTTNQVANPLFVNANLGGQALDTVRNDFRLQAGSPALTGGATPPSDGFFNTTATYLGAFGGATSTNWIAGWTNFRRTYTPYVGTSAVVNEDFSPVAKSFALEQNYPNPFNPTTNIVYSLKAASDVSLKIYDLVGREVETLASGRKAAGQYTVTFNASRLSSGVYFYKLQAGGLTETRKMMLVK